MNNVENFTHWRIDREGDGVAWLRLDKAGTGTNVLAADVMRELDAQLATLESRPPKALVLASAKSGGFIAGADVKEFTSLTTEDEAYAAVRGGQKIFDRLEALPCPTVAAVNGFALGGGLEMALACDYRVLVDDPAASLGFPEVKLGVHPGFGGTVRSIRTIGVLQAMQMMLTGRTMRPDRALKIGLVDRVVPASELEAAARNLALHPPGKKTAGILNRFLELAPARALVSRILERQVAMRVKRRHYPAPYALIELWRRHGADAEARKYDEEARSFARLMCTDTSRNLVRVFLLQDRLKALGAGKKHDIRHVHVVGAGVMGGDIAAWCALRGLQVTLQDREMKYVEPALERAQALFRKMLHDEDAVSKATARLRADIEGSSVADADVVIEAIFEDAEAKQKLYRQIEPKMKAQSVLATNTSSIRLETLRSALADPHRLIGLHFFNPVAKMPLVEVIHTAQTHGDEVSRGLSFARRIDRLPLPCKSAPGFVVNRVLMPYLMEAILLADEGVAYEVIDRAATDFGMPMGPIELADTVGLDVGLHVARILGEAFDLTVPKPLEEKVERQELGRKSGKGFYEYRDGKPVRKPPRDAGDWPDLEDRLMLPLLNEAAACYHDKVIADADLLDAGVIFGTGFAPFRGGPIHYARERGIERIVTRLAELETRYGSRFSPSDGWRELSEERPGM
ncbi:MAG: enoyl-CoA hydratase/isomerase family protein [Gammaproteobacteria bacterium]|nr:enoyl-CoA hydratase/isomerase family protein [Gammaproteobacteria bacterium]